ncbi:DUF3784 domain-containing protein [Clostridium estertheticum]|uniref:DUF3784 domain-containing protein n=1 Tax=Clostridium estertheticum TaxID=238834 RepID=UPI0013E946FB|nr:DUF3784 domain-containing protein [Clostridium estertheticum]MBZ9685569.1 DUF3784 domain-containing protein [Clostridium estertheticum]
MIIIGIVEVLIFSIMGICLIRGKGSWMIAGYNTMSKEEKANCDIKKVSRAVGIFLLIIAVLIGIMYFVIQYAIKNDVKNIIGYAIGGVAFVVAVGSIILVIYCQKYDKNKK